MKTFHLRLQDPIAVLHVFRFFFYSNDPSYQHNVFFARWIQEIHNRDFFDSSLKIAYWWRCSLHTSVMPLIGCYFRAKIQNCATTSQRRHPDLCGATSSVWNLWPRHLDPRLFLHCLPCLRRQWRLSQKDERERTWDRGCDAPRSGKYLAREDNFVFFQWY